MKVTGENKIVELSLVTFFDNQVQPPATASGSDLSSFALIRNGILSSFDRFGVAEIVAFQRFEIDV